MRTFPQAAVELLLNGMFGKPATFMKSVVMEPDPVTTICEPMLEFAV
jgi:hypothetical protein